MTEGTTLVLLIVLLLAALACLVFGIVNASAWWLAGSIALSVVAGVVLWRGRAERPAATSAPAQPAGEDEVDFALARRRADALEAADAAQVWVIDGRPRYHDQGCVQLAGEDAEPVPFEQAVEDGFVACPDCAVSAGSAATGGTRGPGATAASGLGADSGAGESESVVDPVDVPESAAVSAPAARPVGEPTPAAAEPEAGPHHESGARDGAAAGKASSVDSGDVWMIAGRPRFHRRECAIIDGRAAAATPRAAAEAAGLRPCSLCEP